MQSIEDETDRVWRPGPGTIYPPLKGLIREGLAKPSQKAARTARVSYSITESGERELPEMRSAIASFGRKERVIMRRAANLAPIGTLAPILIDRARDGAEILRLKVAQLPEPTRSEVLRNCSSWRRTKQHGRSQAFLLGALQGERRPAVPSVNLRLNHCSTRVL